MSEFNSDSDTYSNDNTQRRRATGGQQQAQPNPTAQQNANQANSGQKLRNRSHGLWIFAGIVFTMMTILVIHHFLSGAADKYKAKGAEAAKPETRYVNVPDPSTRTYELLVTDAGTTPIPIPQSYAADWTTEDKVQFDVITTPTWGSGTKSTMYKKDAPDQTPPIKGPNSSVAFRSHGEPFHIKVCIHPHNFWCPDFNRS